MSQTNCILDDRLWKAIESGSIVVTANQRLARILAFAYDERQRRIGRSVWPSADVLPFDSWLRRCWRELWSDRQLLSPVQTQTLWESIVREDVGQHGLDLLREDSAAELAVKANDLLHDYGLPDWSAAEATPEHEAFSRWRGRFRDLCRDAGWLDPAELVHTVTEAVNDAAMSLPSRILFAGFDEITPAAQRLRAVLASRNVTVEDWTPVPVEGSSCGGTRAVDPADEAAIVVTGIRDAYAPGLSFGVVVPDLDRYRSLFARTFTAELSPAAVLPGNETPEIFNMSLGTPLADEPIAAAALCILRALAAALPWEAALALLQSPFFGEAESEWKERARIEIELRSRRLTEIDVGELASAADRAEARRTAARLHALRSASGEIRAKRFSPSRWAEIFARSLESAGWPGERGRNSREFQAVTAWHETLSDLATLDAQLGSIEATDAITQLTRLCRRIFQPESRTVAPIQVLGLLETAGLRFDHLWITGMHEDALPRPPRPNPFLPVPLQRRHGVPHSTAKIELDFARKFVDRMRRSAPAVIFTTPASVDGYPLRPSPLVTEIPPEAEPARPSGSVSLERAVHRAAASELLDDEPPPAVSASERSRLQGGTGILADQSNCPFRAFARHRLRATELDEPEEDLTPLEWGSTVHRALDLLWARLTTLSALRALDPPSRDELLEAVADQASAILRERLSKRLGEVHRARLSAVLREWVAVELSRETSFEVVAREHRTEIEIGGMPLRVQIDRIDRLADHRHLVIDYKTSRPRTSDWWTDRPVDPQLPIYSQIRDPLLRRLDGLAYAQIRPGESRFLGLTADPGALPGVGGVSESRAAREQEIADWNGLLEHWRRTLEGLAAGFLAGAADVDPLRRGGWPPETCKFCPYPSLCRIHERRPDTDSESAAEESP